MKLHLTKPLAFFDLETTGVNLTEDRIIEISILKVMPDGEKKTLTRRVNPGIPIPSAATDIHGITDEDVKNEPRFEIIAHQLASYLEGCDLAGYNALRFDIPLIAEEFLRAGIEFDIKQRRLIDVQNIFHKMEPRNLSAAYKFYCGSALLNAHSAEADTLATYEVLKSQLERYHDVEIEDKNGNAFVPVRNDVQALHDFSIYSKHADLAGHIVYNDQQVEVFNFGKYKGQSVSDVFKKEPSYYDWMMKSQFPLYTKRVITGIKLRGFNQGDAKINL